MRLREKRGVQADSGALLALRRGIRHWHELWWMTMTNNTISTFLYSAYATCQLIAHQWRL